MAECGVGRSGEIKPLVTTHNQRPSFRQHRPYLRQPAFLLQVDRQADLRIRVDPEQRLQKTLGPWSLTALGIGAIIGSGIFILTGTAAAGEYFQAPSILHAQALDVIINFVRTGSTAGALMHGRPPAGPSIAISFLLVAVACSFAGLCYAELASMIPIAGSAYTYSYATLGEIFAWIIGWDLILEYVVSNVAVAVGFAGYTKAQLRGLRPQLAGKMGEPGLGRRGMDGRLLQSSRLSHRFPSHAAARARSQGVGRDQ